MIETLETQSFNQQKYTDVILPSGYQFVNSKEQLGVNRMRINIENKAFTEVVTDEKKYYYESVKMLPAQKMKTDNAYAKMLSMCRTVNLFKCLNRKCFVTYKKVTEFQKHMHMHFERYAEQKQFPELCANKCKYYSIFLHGFIYGYSIRVYYFLRLWCFSEKENDRPISNVHPVL